jgi:hypothetical protein
MKFFSSVSALQYPILFANREENSQFFFFHFGNFHLFEFVSDFGFRISGSGGLRILCLFVAIFLPLRWLCSLIVAPQLFTDGEESFTSTPRSQR